MPSPIPEAENGRAWNEDNRHGTAALVDLLIMREATGLSVRAIEAILVVVDEVVLYARRFLRLSGPGPGSPDLSGLSKRPTTPPKNARNDQGHGSLQERQQTASKQTRTFMR